MPNGHGSSQKKASNDFYRMPPSRVLEELGTRKKGLSRDEAGRIRSSTGPNEIVADVSVPKWMLFLKQFRDLLVIILIIAGGNFHRHRQLSRRRSDVRHRDPQRHNRFRAGDKAGKILERLREMIKSPAKVLVDGELTEISQRLLVPGDIVEVEAGDKIPADMRLLESFDFKTVEFSLTGESMPSGKTTNAIPEKCIISDQENMAFMGTTVATGNALGVVVRTGMNSEMGKIASMTRDTTEDRSPLQKELGNLARWLTAVVVIISAILFGVAIWQGFSLLTGMILALGIAVAMVPQALPAQVTVALTAASKRLADRKAVVKNLPSVETLGSTTVICTDKTGTLTKNEMTVTSVWFDDGEYTMTGVGYEPEGDHSGFRR